MPDTWSLSLVLVVAIGVVIYGFSKTALPGGGILAGTLLAAALGPAPATGFALPLLIVGDGIALVRYRSGANWRIILGLLPWVVVGLLVSAALFAVLPRDQLSRGLGVLILLSVALEIRRRRVGDTSAGHESPVVRRLWIGFYGTLAGMTTMAANAGGAAMSLYLLKIRIPIVAFLGTSAWFWAIINLVKVPIAAPLGLITAESLRADLMFLPCLLLGAGLGIVVLPRISRDMFSNAVLALSAAAAVWLIVHG